MPKFNISQVTSIALSFARSRPRLIYKANRKILHSETLSHLRSEIKEDRKIAEKIVQKLRHDITFSKYDLPAYLKKDLYPSMSFADAFNEYIRQRRGKVKPSTIAKDTFIFQLFELLSLDSDLGAYKLHRLVAIITVFQFGYHCLCMSFASF